MRDRNEEGSVWFGTFALLLVRRMAGHDVPLG